eukprot:s1003_g9.t1
MLRASSRAERRPDAARGAAGSPRGFPSAPELRFIKGMNGHGYPDPSHDRPYAVPGKAAEEADDSALMQPEVEDRAAPGGSKPEKLDRAERTGKVWLKPEEALEAVKRLVGGRDRSKDPRAAPLGDCHLLGFWGSSGEEIRIPMRWDGLQYYCSLDIPAGEDAMLQVSAPAGRIYPSVEGANPSIRHELLGPHPVHGDQSWFLDSSRLSRKAQIFVACPRGCAVALGWRIEGEEIPEAEEQEEWEEMGGWQSLGFGEAAPRKQGAVVYTGRWPASGSGGIAAVKFPVEAQELQYYARVHDIPGLPDLLDFGIAQTYTGCRLSNKGFYMAMSRTEPCLDTLLRGHLHIHDSWLTCPKILGRLSWPVAADLGVRLLRTLQAIHRKGILHCDMKPGNILLRRGEPWVQLIDFGRAGNVGQTRFDAGHGGMRDYMSVKSGMEGGQRSTADDVESLGWLLFRCLHGGFPWSAKSPDGRSWALQIVYITVPGSGTDTVMDMPEEIVGGPGAEMEAAGAVPVDLADDGFRKLPAEYRYCPAPLMQFLRRVRQASNANLADEEYDILAKLLLSDTTEPSEASRPSQGKLEQFVLGFFSARDEGIHRKGMWPYAGPS